MTIYDYSVQDAQGGNVPLKDYKGKVLLIVNTATKCGFTPHYKDLEQMYEKYHEQGLEIIDVPCNQFGGRHRVRTNKSASSARSITTRNFRK